MIFTARIMGLGMILILLCGCTPLEEANSGNKNQNISQTKIIEAKKEIPNADNKTINFCTEYCYFVRGGEQSKLKFNESSEKFFCQCFDYEKNLIIKKEITEQDLELYQQKKVKWENMPITYLIINKDECGDYETRKIHRAFERIQEATDEIVRFEEVQKDANIELTCKFIKDCYEKKIDIRKEEGVIYKSEAICPHEAGVAKITDYQGFTLRKATIDLIGLAGFAETGGNGASGFYIGSCGHPSVEIHEILHTFGFSHTPNPESIMYYQAELVPYTILQEGACLGSDKKIDQEIIDDLLYMYG